MQPEMITALKRMHRRSALWAAARHAVGEEQFNHAAPAIEQAVAEILEAEGLGTNGENR